MVFSSLSFLYIFLPLVLIAFYLVPKRAKNAVLLLFSLVFYFVGEQERVLLMVLSAVVDYCCSLVIDQNREKRLLTRLCLAVSLCFNLGLLAYFKYADLLISAVNAICGTGLALWEVALPIGISFYTFQTMSYTVDVYRGEKAERNFLDFACYVTLFPQLIAGPIVRYRDIAAELRAHELSFERFEKGVRRFCVGLAKKVLLANSLAVLSAQYEPAEGATVLMAWLSGLATPLQIYFDFSGYSDMAIGLGHMFGFTFPENFNYPLISKSATEFWRRWHMTLGSWFRDYLYIPLGGNRVKLLRHILNLLIVWAATGLWHGAAANFILWGLFYGVLLILEKYLLGDALEKGKVWPHLSFALLTVVGFEIFSAESVAEIGLRIGQLFGAGGIALGSVGARYTLLSYLPLLVISLIGAMPVVPATAKRLAQSGKPFEERTWLRAAVDVIALALLIVSTAYLVDGSYNPFLYFRF